MANKFKKYGERKFRQMVEGECFLPGRKYMITKKSFMAFENDYEENKSWIKDISCIEFSVNYKQRWAQVCSGNMSIGYTLNPKWCYEIIEVGGRKQC